MLKSIHVKALGVWLIYSFITKGSFIAGISRSLTGLEAYLLNIFFSIFFGCLFLYFFNHEDFFPFAKEIERKNIKKERQWEHRFLHYGKMLSAILIGVAGGPLIGALAVRFLLARYKYKYWIIAIASALSATLWLGIARGVIIWRLPF